MATQTSYLGLTKPAQSDNYNIDDFNNNADKIDEKMKEHEDNLTSHLAEKVTHLVTATRDLTLTGVQVISGFPFVVESVDIVVVVNGTQKFSLGKFGNDQNCSVFQVQGSTNWLRSTTNAIRLGDNGVDMTQATVSINSDKTISFNWTHAGNGATGTANIYIHAFAHGGE